MHSHELKLVIHLENKNHSVDALRTHKLSARDTPSLSHFLPFLFKHITKQVAENQIQ